MESKKFIERSFKMNKDGSPDLSDNQTQLNYRLFKWDLCKNCIDERLNFDDKKLKIEKFLYYHNNKVTLKITMYDPKYELAFSQIHRN